MEVQSIQDRIHHIEEQRIAHMRLNSPTKGGGANHAASEAEGESHHEDVPNTAENREKIGSALAALDKLRPQQSTTRFQFSVHAETGKIQITLLNFMTGEIVEQIPSGKLLNFAASLEELTGLLVEKRA